MNNFYSERKKLYQPLFNQLKDYLHIASLPYFKEHDEALFNAPKEILNQEFYSAIDSYIFYVGNHRNRKWVIQIKNESPIELFLNGSVSSEFDIDFLRYATDLLNKLMDLYSDIEEGCQLSDLREDLYSDANELEKNFERFASQIKESSSEEEKMFARITNAFIRGGDTDGFSFTTKVWKYIDYELPSFGEADDPQFATYALLKHRLYIFNDAIKSKLDYHYKFFFDFQKAKELFRK